MHNEDKGQPPASDWLTSLNACGMNELGQDGKALLKQLFHW